MIFHIKLPEVNVNFSKLELGLRQLNMKNQILLNLV